MNISQKTLYILGFICLATTYQTNLALNLILWAKERTANSYATIASNPLPWLALAFQIYQSSGSNKTQMLELELLALKKEAHERQLLGEARDAHLKRQEAERDNDEKEITALREQMKYASPTIRATLQKKLDLRILASFRRRELNDISTQIARQEDPVLRHKMSADRNLWLRCAEREMINPKEMDSACRSIREFEHYFQPQH